MKISILTSMFILLVSLFSFAQSNMKIFYDMLCLPVSDSTNAKYYKIISSDLDKTKSQTVYLYSMEGKLFSQGEVKDQASDSLRMEGLWTTYDEEGNLSSESFYINNRRNGILTNYRNDGTVLRISDYREDYLNGHKTYYYRNKSVKCDDLYENNKFISGRCFDSLGIEIPHYFIEQMPQYPGGVVKMQSFISKNFKYPRKLLRKSIEGRTYITFILDNTGKITEPFISKSIHPLLDAEAMRVIMLMPRWIPGTIEDVPVRVQMTIPIKCVIR